MILKPIKDDKIEKIINESKDFEMKLTSEQVLKEFETRKAKKQVKVNEEIIEPVKKKKIFPYLGMGLASLATCAVVISVVFANQNSKITYTNISNNVSVLTNSEASKSLGKELLLFNFNYDSNNDIATKALKNAYQVKYASSDFVDSIDKIITRVVTGFEKVSQIFLNGILDFNDMKIDSYELDKPKIIEGKEFDHVISYRYGLVVGFKYYYSSSNELDYGYTEIDNGLFGDKSYYKTSINVVTKDDNKFIETSLNKDNCYFKINNEGSKKASDSIFNYFTFINKDDFESKNPLNRYFVSLDKSGNNSSFSLQNKNEYKIDYSNISNSILNLITCSFNVQYFDLVDEITKTFDNVKLSLKGDKNEYDINGNIVKI